MITQELREVHRGRPALLDELRWGVYSKEAPTEDNTVDVISETYKKSFNRTLRDHFPSLNSLRRSASELLHLPGLLSCVALYRLRPITIIETVLAQTELVFRANVRVLPARDAGQRRKINFVEFRVLAGTPGNLVIQETVRIPTNSRIVLVSENNINNIDLVWLNEVVWTVEGPGEKVINPIVSTISPSDFSYTGKQ